MDLETVIRQMDEVIMGVQCVLIRRSSDIPCSIHHDLKFLGHQHPDPDIELPTFIEKRSFDILLHNPNLVGLPLIDEAGYLLE